MKTTREILKQYAIQTNHNQELLDISGLKCKVVNNENWFSVSDVDIEIQKAFKNDELLTKWLEDSIKDRLPLILEQLQKELKEKLVRRFGNIFGHDETVKIIDKIVDEVFNNFTVNK